jgi:hypothetical protein
MVTVTQIAWLAGLLEGEGSFGMWNGSNAPYIQLAMSDGDVVMKAAALMQSSVRRYESRDSNRKTMWHTRTHGTRAVGWMLSVYLFMGERRQARIREVMQAWLSSPHLPRAIRGNGRQPASCHPDRLRNTRGLCGACYMREYRAGRTKPTRKSRDLKHYAKKPLLPTA